MSTSSGRRRHTKGLLAMAGVLALAILVPTVAAAAAQPGGGLRKAQHATEMFQHVHEAEIRGYGKFTDVNGITCIDNLGVGGMGIHYVNGILLNDPGLNVATPEATVYQPMPGGKLKLVALEYIVTKAGWEGAGNTSPPRLFGHNLNLILAPNRYGLPDFYEIHAWIYKDNPSGEFSDWNPRVNCANAVA
jgi:hypothetical protein